MRYTLFFVKQSATNIGKLNAVLKPLLVCRPRNNLRNDMPAMLFSESRYDF